MEGVSVNVYNGLKQYWKTKRKGYERISCDDRRRKCGEEFGTADGVSGRKKPSWRIKLTSKEIGQTSNGSLFLCPTVQNFPASFFLAVKSI
nr:uncharacterized protein LOC109158620 [Ipomoea trifida]